MDIQSPPPEQDLEDSLSQKIECKQWGFVGTLIWGVVVAILFIIVQTIALIVYAYLDTGGLPADFSAFLSDGTYLSVATFSTLLICGPILCGIIKLKKGSNLREYLSLNPIELSQLKYWLLAAVLTVLVLDLLTVLLGKPVVPEYMTLMYSSTPNLWPLFFALVLAAPIFEEMFFRGFLLSGLCSTFLGPIGAIVVTSILWAAIHQQYDLFGMFLIVTLGVVLGIARLKTNSIFTTIAMHSVVNCVAFIEASIFVSLQS